MDIEIIRLNDNGAWSWFMDERAIVHQGKLLVGSIRSTDTTCEKGKGQKGWGNCEVAVHDIALGKTSVVVLHEHLEQDDHDGPALHVRSDGRVVAIYTRHSQERKVYWRVSESDDLLRWGARQELITPGEDHPPFGGDNVTYSNPFRLPSEGGRTYNFFRSLRHQQNYMVSEDDAQTWRYGGMFLHGHRGYAPYFKYATNYRDTIHFIGTEDHPRNFDNSVYHGFVRGGTIYKSDGTVYAPLSTTPEKSGDIWDLTPVFKGDADNVAWVTDLHLDADGWPFCVFSVQKDGRGLRPGQGGLDHRCHYARWDGNRWREYEIGYAGTRLYPGEDDYTGGAALDPHDSSTVFLSTDSHPATGEALVSAADGRRHYELFRGRTSDEGKTWSWEALTSDSRVDNLRPIIPVWPNSHLALIWMRGTYHHNRGPWSTEVVATFLRR